MVTLPWFKFHVPHWRSYSDLTPHARKYFTSPSSEFSKLTPTHAKINCLHMISNSDWGNQQPNQILLTIFIMAIRFHQEPLSKCKLVNFDPCFLKKYCLQCWKDLQLRQKIVNQYFTLYTTVIHGQLIFAQMGVSFENSDGGLKFFQHGGSLINRAFDGGSWTLERNRFTLKKWPFWCRSGVKLNKQLKLSVPVKNAQIWYFSN